MDDIIKIGLTAALIGCGSEGMVWDDRQRDYIKYPDSNSAEYEYPKALKMDEICPATPTSLVTLGEDVKVSSN